MVMHVTILLHEILIYFAGKQLIHDLCIRFCKMFIEFLENSIKVINILTRKRS